MRRQVEQQVPQSRMALVAQMLEHFQQILAVPGDQPRLPLVDVHLVPGGHKGKQNGKQPQENVGRSIFARC